MRVVRQPRRQKGAVRARARPAPPTLAKNCCWARSKQPGCTPPTACSSVLSKLGATAEGTRGCSSVKVRSTLSRTMLLPPPRSLVLPPPPLPPPPPLLLLLMLKTAPPADDSGGCSSRAAMSRVNAISRFRRSSCTRWKSSQLRLSSVLRSWSTSLMGCWWCCWPCSSLVPRPVPAAPPPPAAPSPVPASARPPSCSEPPPTPGHVPPGSLEPA